RAAGDPRAHQHTARGILEEHAAALPALDRDPVDRDVALADADEARGAAVLREHRPADRDARLLVHEDPGPAREADAYVFDQTGRFAADLDAFLLRAADLARLDDQLAAEDVQADRSA